MARARKTETDKPVERAEGNSDADPWSGFLGELHRLAEEAGAAETEEQRADIVDRVAELVASDEELEPPEFETVEERVTEGHGQALAALARFEDACMLIGPDRLHSSLRTILEDYRTCRGDVMALVDRIKARHAA